MILIRVYRLDLQVAAFLASNHCFEISEVAAGHNIHCMPASQTGVSSHTRNTSKITKSSYRNLCNSKRKSSYHLKIKYQAQGDHVNLRLDFETDRKGFEGVLRRIGAGMQ